MKHTLAMAIMGVCLAAGAPQAIADDDNDRRLGHGSYALSADDALAIAAAYGLDWVKEIKRGNGNWEIEGCTYDGREIEIDISGWSGDIVKLEYEDDDDC